MNTFGPYSPIRQAGNLYFIAGQIGINPDTNVAASDIANQTQQTLENLKALLKQNGLSMDNIIKTTIFLAHMEDFAAMNEVYTTYFKEPRPARATVEVARLPLLAENELLVEIEAVVYKP